MSQIIIGVIYVLDSIRDYIRIKVKVREDFKLKNYTFCIFDRGLRRSVRQLEGKCVSVFFRLYIYLKQSLNLIAKKKKKIIVL